MNILWQTGSKASVNHNSVLVSYAPALMLQGTNFTLTLTIKSMGKLSLNLITYCRAESQIYSTARVLSVRPNSTKMQRTEM
jgi:hypothetical protein